MLYPYNMCTPGANIFKLLLLILSYRLDLKKKSLKMYLLSNSFFFTASLHYLSVIFSDTRETYCGGLLTSLLSSILIVSSEFLNFRYIAHC